MVGDRDMGDHRPEFHRIFLFKVALGGGRKYFKPVTTNDPEYPSRKNTREDGQDLIEQWLEANQLNGLRAEYVWNKTAFDDVNPVTTDRLLG